MIRARRSDERGRFDHGWLDTFHSFSFGDYLDPEHMGFRSLRVLNEDVVAPGMGFGRHGHRDMEILTVVLEGALRHEDSLGNGSVLRAGRLQRMTAGTGVLHSEVNASATEPVHLIQIWVLPDRKGHAPGYEERAIDPEEAAGRWRLLASDDGRDGSLTVHQDVALWLARLRPGASAAFALEAGRHAWLQVTRGELRVNGLDLKAGDGAAVSDEPALSVVATADAEVLLFDLA